MAENEKMATDAEIASYESDDWWGQVRVLMWVRPLIARIKHEVAERKRLEAEQAVLEAPLEPVAKTDIPGAEIPEAAPQADQRAVAEDTKPDTGPSQDPQELADQIPGGWR